MIEKNKPLSIVKNESEQAILKARAQALAKEPEKIVPASELLEIITFRLGGDTYGIESVYVREVYPLRDFTPLPGVPAFILGIINVRGQILSIVNLKVFFKLPGKGLGDLNKVIILHNNLMKFGLLADEIVGTASVLLSTLQLSLPTITGVGREFMKGITAENLIILDGDKLLNERKMIVHEEIAFTASK